MKLHEYRDVFDSLVSIVANKLHIPESAVERDYYIVLLLKVNTLKNVYLRMVHHLANVILDLLKDFLKILI